MLDWINDPRRVIDAQESIRTEEVCDALWWKHWEVASRQARESAAARAVEARRNSVAASSCQDKDTGRFPHLCRKCTWCLKQRAKQWVARAKHEYLSHDRTWFITLTFRGSEQKFYREVQLWLKLIRRDLAKHSKSSLRYMVSEETGEKHGRLHWHVLMHCPSTVTRRFLSRRWKHGFSKMVLAKTIGLASYIAKYAGKIGRMRASVAYGNGLRAIQRARPDLCSHYDDWLLHRSPCPQWVRVWGRVSQHEITIGWATAPPF